MYVPKHLKIKLTDDKGKSLVANKVIKKGECVLKIQGVLQTFKELDPKDSDYALQVGDNLFVNSKYYMAGDFMNHSCNPNTMVDILNMKYIAIRNIDRGEDITFNYNTTEYDLVRDKLDFDCKCRSRKCIGRIKGFKFLTKKQKLELIPILPDYLKKKIK